MLFILIKIIPLIYSFTYFEVENHLGLNHLISYYFLFILLLLYIKYYIIKLLKVWRCFGSGLRHCLEKLERLSGALGSRLQVTYVYSHAPEKRGESKAAAYLTLSDRPSKRSQKLSYDFTQNILLGHSPPEKVPKVVISRWLQ